MAIIIKKKNGAEKYIMLGSGFGMFRSQKPNWLLGNLAADTESGGARIICACDEKGEMVWLNAEEYQVYSIDGLSPSECFQP